MSGLGFFIVALLAAGLSLAELSSAAGRQRSGAAFVYSAVFLLAIVGFAISAGLVHPEFVR